jgi:hypothetical protein
MEEQNKLQIPLKVHPKKKNQRQLRVSQSTTNVLKKSKTTLSRNSKITNSSKNLSDMDTISTYFHTNPDFNGTSYESLSKDLRELKLTKENVLQFQPFTDVQIIKMRRKSYDIYSKLKLFSFSKSKPIKSPRASSLYRKTLTPKCQTPTQSTPPTLQAMATIHPHSRHPFVTRNLPQHRSCSTVSNCSGASKGSYSSEVPTSVAEIMEGEEETFTHSKIHLNNQNHDHELNQNNNNPQVCIQGKYKLTKLSQLNHHRNGNASDGNSNMNHKKPQILINNEVVSSGSGGCTPANHANHLNPYLTSNFNFKKKIKRRVFSGENEKSKTKGFVPKRHYDKKVSTFKPNQKFLPAGGLLRTDTQNSNKNKSDGGDSGSADNRKK